MSIPVDTNKPQSMTAPLGQPDYKFFQHTLKDNTNGQVPSTNQVPKDVLQRKSRTQV